MWDPKVVLQALILPKQASFITFFLHASHITYRKLDVREMLKKLQAMRKSRTSLRWSPPGFFALEG